MVQLNLAIRRVHLRVVEIRLVPGLRGLRAGAVRHSLVIDAPFHCRATYCCLSNFGRCGRSQDRVSVNCPLVERIYPAEWMAEKLFRTVDHPS